MAKNYTLAEITKIIVEGTDLEQILDVGRRYPILSHKIATIGALAGDKLIDLMNYMPDYVTGNKIDKAMKNSITGEDNEETDVETTEEDKPAKKPAKKAAKKVEEEVEETDEDNPYAGKNAMDLFKECKKRGLKVKPKQKANVYVQALLEDDAKANEDGEEGWDEEEKPAKPAKKAAKKKAEPVEEDDDWDI